MRKEIFKKCHRRYYPLSLNIDTQYRMQLTLFLIPGRACDGGLSDCCRTSVSATGPHWGGERKNENCQHNKWSSLVQPVMHFVISVETGDRCGHEQRGGRMGRPARMLKDVSGCELYDNAVRSDRWKPAIKTEFQFSINRFKQ